MSTYSITVEDIYDRNKNKKLMIRESNAMLAHRRALCEVSALREDVIRITNNGRVVFSLKDGFCEN